MNSSVILNNSSFIAKDSIDIEKTLTLYGTYDVTDDTKELIKDFLVLEK